MGLLEAHVLFDPFGFSATPSNSVWARLTDAGLTQVIAKPRQTLTLDGCPFLTDAGLTHLTVVPLEPLSLDGCYLLGEAELLRDEQHIWLVHILRVST
jgi:hypothetical protein